MIKERRWKYEYFIIKNTYFMCSCTMGNNRDCPSFSICWSAFCGYWSRTFSCWGTIAFYSLSYTKKEIARRTSSYPASCGCRSKYGRLSAAVFSAVIKTGVAVGTMVAIGSAPLLSGVLDYIVYRKKPAKKWLLATFTGIIGCCSLLLKKDSQIDVIGLGMAIGAGATFACYTTVNKSTVG